MSDLIRKSDALAVAQDASDNSDEPQDVVSAIAALPAVTVGVKPLVWSQTYNNAGDLTDVWCADDPLFEHRWWAEHADKIPKIEAKRTARILAALEPVAAPDPAAIREAWEKAYWRMRSYAVHDNDCKLNKPPRFDGPCSCGLTAALEEALALIQKGTDHE